MLSRAAHQSHHGSRARKVDICCATKLKFLSHWTSSFCQRITLSSNSYINVWLASRLTFPANIAQWWNHTISSYALCCECTRWEDSICRPRENDGKKYRAAREQGGKESSLEKLAPNFFATFPLTLARASCCVSTPNFIDIRRLCRCSDTAREHFPCWFFAFKILCIIWGRESRFNRYSVMLCGDSLESWWIDTLFHWLWSRFPKNFLSASEASDSEEMAWWLISILHVPWSLWSAEVLYCGKYYTSNEQPHSNRWQHTEKRTKSQKMKVVVWAWNANLQWFEDWNQGSVESLQVSS